MTTLLRILLILLVGCLSTPVSAELKTDQKQIDKFIDEMVRTHKFKRTSLQSLFQRTQLHQSIIDSISRPAEGKPWHEYRKIFLTSKRVNGGEQFWQEHAHTLARAEKEFGVPAEIIVAIIGVETRYGHHKGKYPVLDALTTLAFHYPARAKFFRKELEEYLLLTREEGLDPLSLKGSYAGAMGTPQFISSSYRRYAVDFDNDGKRDLINSTTDAIGSVANYFKKHRWASGKDVTLRANVKNRNHQAIVDLGLKPKTPLAKLENRGIRIMDRKSPREQLGALIELENGDGKEHWVGLQNFYVITRYNHSPLYAMAVYQLSQQILARKPNTMEN